MRESIPKLNRDQLLKDTKLTEEHLEKLLEVKTSNRVGLGDIRRNIEHGAFIRFLVTKRYDIFIAPGNNSHKEMMDDNGLMSEDCLITNGALWEGDNGNLTFSYQATPVTILHSAVEKKIIKFFKAHGIEFRNNH